MVHVIVNVNVRQVIGICKCYNIHVVFTKNRVRNSHKQSGTKPKQVIKIGKV